MRAAPQFLHISHMESRTFSLRQNMLYLDILRVYPFLQHFWTLISKQAATATKITAETLMTKITQEGTCNDNAGNLGLGLFPLRIEGVTGFFVKECSAAALFIALGFGELYFGPEATLGAPNVPFALFLVAVEEGEISDVTVVKIDFASGEERRVLGFLAFDCLVGIDGDGRGSLGVGQQDQGEQKIDGVMQGWKAFHEKENWLYIKLQTAR